MTTRDTSSSSASSCPPLEDLGQRLEKKIRWWNKTGGGADVIEMALFIEELIDHCRAHAQEIARLKELLEQERDASTEPE